MSSSSKPIDQDEMLHPIDQAEPTVLPNFRMGKDLPNGAKCYGRVQISKQQNTKEAGRNSARGRMTPK